MGLKGGRRIVVRDLTFRWVFSGKNDRYGNSPFEAHVAIQEDAERPGRPLVAWLLSRNWISAESHDGATGHITHRARFTPADVRSVIESALDDRWNPSSRELYEVAAGLLLTSYSTVSRNRGR